MRNRNKHTLTPNRHGKDISSNYEDVLDYACLQHVEELAKKHPERDIKTLDLGCGLGAISIKMAELGARVTMFDLSNMPKNNIIRAIAEKRVRYDNIIFKKESFASLSEDKIPNDLDIFYSQRALHFLRYEELKNTLSNVFNKMADGGKAFLSLASCEGSFAILYPALRDDLKERFCRLDKKVADLTNIHHPLTLYHPKEVENLMNTIGFKNIELDISGKSRFNITVSAVKII